MPLKIIFLFFILVLPGKNFGQQPFYRNINTSEGLPGTETYACLQDKKGYMWFSSDAGVCRYNGRSFQYFNTSNGLPDNSVFRLIEDKKGRIWMACYNGSVCYYENGRINVIPATEQLKKLLRNGYYLVISMEMDDAGTLWLGTTKTLYKIPAQNKYASVIADSSFQMKSTFVIYTLSKGKAVNSMYNCYYSIEGAVNQRGFVFEVDSKDVPKHISFELSWRPYNPVFRSVLTHDGKLFFSYADTLYQLASSGKLSRKVFPQSIIMLNEDDRGNVNVGISKGGIYSFAHGDMDTEPFHYFEKLSVSSFVKDNEGGLWFTTLEKGVFYSPFSNYFLYYDTPGLTEKIVGVGTAKDHLLIANYKKELFVSDSSGKISELHSIPEKNGAIGMHFYTLGGKIYACGNRISEIDLKLGEINYFKSGSGQPFTAVGMTQNEEGKFSILAFGIYMEMMNGMICKKVRLESRPTCMLKTADGKILAGTIAGLFVLKDTSFLPLGEYPPLEDVRITALAEKNNILYVATRNKGIFIRENGTWMNMNRNKGLASDQCNDIFPDEDGKVWVATNNGITFFEQTKKQCTSIDASNGLPVNEVSSLTRFGKSLFIGTRGGLCEIKLDRPYLNQDRPVIYLNTVTVNDSLRSLTDPTVFEYDRDHFSFGIDCITFKKRSAGFVYHLKGYDDSLRYSANLAIEYTNLQPGSYTFEAYAVNSNGLLSEGPATYSFTIREPWWKTWWFYVFEAVVFISVLSLVIQWRIRVVKKQEEQKREIEKTIAEYQMTALQAQMNPHFVFNAINSIQNFILKNDTQPAYDYLAKFSKLIRLVLHNSMHNVITLEKETEALKLYVELEQLRFKESFDFELTIRTGDQLEIEIPTMLLQPYIENAIWHGIMPLEGKRKGKIKMNITLAGENLKISIEDNGVGRKHSNELSKLKTHQSVGMSLVEQKIDILKKTTLLTTTIHVIDLHDENGAASGTRIELLIPHTTEL